MPAISTLSEKRNGIMKLSKTVLLIIYGSLLALLWLFIPHNENWTQPITPKINYLMVVRSYTRQYNQKP